MDLLARIGSVPAEEYGFVVLEVLLVGAWAVRCGALPPPATVLPPHARLLRVRGARCGSP